LQEPAGEKSATALLAQVTIPVGEAPAMVAVQVVFEPSATGEGEQLTLVVDADFDTWRVKLPGMGAAPFGPP